jgi:hypothetical protein
MKGKAGKRVRTKKESVRMPYLSSVSFLNLKAFGDWQTLPIKPLNLIFGKNSSGKSSIFHALLWFRDVLCYGDLNVMMPEKSGDFVDLGGLWQFVHFNKEKQKRIGIRLNIGDPDAVLFERLKEMSSNLQSEESGDDGWSNSLVQESLKTWGSVKEAFFPGDSELHYVLEIEFNLIGLKPEDRYQSIHIAPEVSLYIGQEKILHFRPLTNALSRFSEEKNIQDECSYQVKCESPLFHQQISSLFADLADSVSCLGKRISGRSNHKWKPSPQELSQEIQKRKLNVISFSRNLRGICVFPGGRSLKDAGDCYRVDPGEYDYPDMDTQEKARLRIFNELMSDLFGGVSHIVQEAANTFFRDLNYLAAYRSYPGREISQKVMRNVRYEPHGSESYRDALVDTKTVERLNQACKKLNADFEIKLSGDRKEWAGTRLQILKNGHELSFRDIGFGWSQVIPVLVELAQQKYSAIFVEQPELHLHPNNQSELMDVILENLPQKKNSVSPIFLELHSEQMVLRLLRRIREGGKKKTGGIHPDDCSVIHVSKGDDGSVIQKLELSNAGTMVDPWPGGFFESALRDF